MIRRIAFGRLGAAALALCAAGCAPTWKPSGSTAAPVVREDADPRWIPALRLVPSTAEVVRGFAVADLERAPGVRPFVIRPVELEILRALDACDTASPEVTRIVTASGAAEDTVSVFLGKDAGGPASVACLQRVVKFGEGTTLRGVQPDVLVVASGRWQTAAGVDASDPPGFGAAVPSWASMWMVLRPPSPDAEGAFADVDGARVLLDLRAHPRLEFELHTVAGRTAAVYRRWRKTRVDRSLLAGIPAMAFVDHAVTTKGANVTLVARGLR